MCFKKKTKRGESGACPVEECQAGKSEIVQAKLITTEVYLFRRCLPRLLTDHLTSPVRLYTYRPTMPSYDPDKWIGQLMTCQHLPEQEMKILCERVRCILMEESNIQPVSSPVTICGDIHGQFWDLIELLRKGGKVPETSYIFMVCVRSIPRRKGQAEIIWECRAIL